MDNLLLLSILLVFLAALVGSVLQHRRMDRVLKDLRGFQVTLQLAEKRIWGRFKLYANALELLFGKPYTNRRGNQLSSYIIFNEQIGDIEAIFRFHDELTSEHQSRRLTEIEKAKNPDLMSRIKRTLRNFLVAFREAIDESIGLLLSRVQKKAATGLLKGQEGYLKKLGSSTVGIVSTSAFDPVLENYINQQVVLEAGKIDGQRIEYVGVLKEYSSGWISLLDCHIGTENKLPLNDAVLLKMHRKIDFKIKLGAQNNHSEELMLELQITNLDSQTLSISRIKNDEGFQFEIGELLAPGEIINIQVENLPPESLKDIKLADLPLSLKLNTTDKDEITYPSLPDLTLMFDIVRDVDIYIPRSRGLLRHASGM